jgi:DNA-directed RNA polymerase alpha subunit
MQMKKEEVATELLRAAEENGVVETLYAAFGKCVQVSVPFGRRACETPIDELEFSVRASNALKRAGIFTVGQAIDLIADDGLLRVRNLGKKTQNEIKTRILAFGYEGLSARERLSFFWDVVGRNCRSSG